MVGHPGRRVPALLLVSAAATAGMGGLAACGGAASHAAGSGPTRAADQTGLYAAVKLRGALLTQVNGVAAAAPAQYGRYASLAAVRAASLQARAGSGAPKSCAQATVTGLDSAALSGAAAAAVTFQVGQNGVSEVLAAPSPSAAGSALASKVPAGCERYKATADGRTVSYTVSESAIAGIGDQARVVSVQTAGRPADDIWSIVYRGTGFVGAVTVAGPNASELAARELAQQAYAFAAKTLS